MGIAQDVIKRADELALDRMGFEAEWDEIATLGLPMADLSKGRAYKQLDRAMAPRTSKKVPQVFDNSLMTSIDRLAAGMESLTMPSADKWHGLENKDPFGADPTDEEEKWFERTRDFMFSYRYDPKVGFQTATQNALMRTVAFGTAVKEISEDFGRKWRGKIPMPMTYKHIPITQCYLSLDADYNPDTNYRRFSMTARQLVQKFGPDAVSDKVKRAADNQKDQDKHFDVIYAVQPRAEQGGKSNTRKNSAFATYWVEEEGGHLIADGGYFDFPFIVYYWSQGDEAYGESPVMKVLAEMRRLNFMAKNSLRAFQQYTDPPLALPNDRSMNRPNLNPRALNYGAIDENGQPRVRPLITSQRPDFAEQLLEAKRAGIKDSLYINLFQALLESPDTTATQAMIRADEKGQLLGPAGTKIQRALSFMVEREFNILERKGAFEPGSKLAPPESLAGADLGVKFTSPLDRMRRSSEAIGIIRTYETAGMIAQAKNDPSVFDRFDDGKAIDITREVNGAPASIMRSDDQVEEMRAQRQEQAQAAAMQQASQVIAQGSQATSSAAQAAADVGEAVKQNPELLKALTQGQ